MWFKRRRRATPESDRIWNRAALDDLAPDDARPGDIALRDAVEFDGYVMNGGLDHALDVTGREAERAAAGWEFLGRRDVATVIREALAIVPDMPDDPEARQAFFIDGWSDEQAGAIERLSDRYFDLSADQDALEQAFLRHLDEHPHDFAAGGP